MRERLLGTCDDAPFLRCLGQLGMIMLADEFVMVLDDGIGMKVLCPYPQWTCFKGGEG